jgi:carboxyl-terminal processing protease
MVRDVYVFVGAKKVFYQAQRGKTSARDLAFSATIPLSPGINYVTAVARENNDVASRRTFVVRRDGPNGALLETPRFDDEEFGEEHSPDAIEP